MNHDNFNDNKNMQEEQKGSAENGPSGIYGMSYAPGENGYSYSPYGSYYIPDKREEKKIKKKKRILVTVTAMLTSGIILCVISGFFGAYIAGYIKGNGNSLPLLPSETTGETDEETTPAVNAGSETPKGNAVVYKAPADETYATELTDVISAVKPGVVEIVTEYVVHDSWFGNYTQSGAGSGVIIMKSEGDDGYYYVVTNNHVIEGSDNIAVILTDGSEYKGELVGTDIFSDIALVRIKAESGKSLPIATIADSDDLLDGQEIFVIGNPLGTLGGSVTKGIISCTEREISVDGIKMTLLQIDAAVNPGNSGGALFDTNGNLVGVVNAKYSDETVEGLGFAIPINRAMESVDSIYKHGYVKGIATLDLSLADQSYTSNSSAVTRPTLTEASSIKGVVVDSGESFSFSAGDFIDSVNGTVVTGSNEFFSKLTEYEVGEKVELVVYRRELSNSLWGRYEYVAYTVSVELTEFVPDYISR